MVKSIDAINLLNHREPTVPVAHWYAFLGSNSIQIKN